MLLDALKDFEWYNEPADVIFKESGMLVTAEPQTDFWQNVPRQFYKDDAHFFFTRKKEDFCLEVSWKAENLSSFDQCGIMVRVDEKNWLKASVLSENTDSPCLGTIVTQNGSSDWAVGPCMKHSDELTFRVKRRNGDYTLWFRFGDNPYILLRQLHLLNDCGEIKAGAYIASPRSSNFMATLTFLKI